LPGTHPSPFEDTALPDTDSAAASVHPATPSKRRRQRGQVLAIFAVAMVVFVGILAIVVDISWYWASSLKVQRAADAAALAGVVWLPGDPSRGIQTAANEAAKDGYTAGVGITISANQDSLVTSGGNPNQMDVTISAPVNTFFMRLFGITKITTTRTSHAVYVLPVPMGSPQNYFGDFGKVRHPGGGVDQPVPAQYGPLSPTASHSPNGWTNPANAYTSNNGYATSSTTNAQQGWSSFGIPSLPGGATVDGIQVQIEAHSSPANCRISVALSWNNGGSYTTSQTITGLTTSDALYGVGGTTDTWGRTWSSSDLTNANFVVRLQDADSCSAHTISVDQVQVLVAYHTTTFVADANLTDPNGAALAPQGFWGTVMSQGGESLNGDIYSPYYDNSTGPLVTNPYYAPTTYYNYDIQMPVGGSNGKVWLYDAPFCASDGSGQYGTGDRWLDGDSNSPISTYFTLYDTKNTQDQSDDTQTWASGSTFAQTKGYSDADLDGSGGTSCAMGDTETSFTQAHSDHQCDASLTAGIDCHLRWFELPATLTGGEIYRLHITTTGSTSQVGSDGHNSFTIWASASGGTPQVFGVGAMETYEPLPGGGASIFYLAQIGAEHAGKTMQINLWDPGDTKPLSASLKILAPTVTGYTPTTFSWSAQKVNSQGNVCTGTGTNVTSVTTNVGNTTGTFNGCWLTILVQIPTNYTAPAPPGETNGGGWWKIEYDMGGSSSDSAFDLTTWQVDLLGNPVHLVVP